MTTGPITIADLTRDGKLLEIGCLGCGRHVYVDASRSGLLEWPPVPEVSARFVCSRCGALNQPTIRSTPGRTTGLLVCYSWVGICTPLGLNRAVRRHAQEAASQLTFGHKRVTL
jgi:hypothetical protein